MLGVCVISRVEPETSIRLFGTHVLWRADNLEPANPGLVTLENHWRENGFQLVSQRVPSAAAAKNDLDCSRPRHCRFPPVGGKLREPGQLLEVFGTAFRWTIAAAQAFVTRRKPVAEASRLPLDHPFQFDSGCW